MGYFNVIRSGEQASKAVRFRSVFLYGYWKCGRVRLIAPVLKTDGSKGSVSSNLTASTKHRRLPEWLREQFAKLSLRKWRIGSNPIPSAN